MDGPAPDRVGAYFTTKAAAYSDASATGLWRTFRNWEETAVLSLTQPAPGDRILDAGTGAGFYAERFLGAGAHVTAQDLVPAMADRVRERLDIECLVGDLCTMELPPRFDKVVCAGALEFVSDPAAAVRRMAAALDPNGPRILVLLLPRADFTARLYRRFHRTHGFSVNLFSTAEVQSLAASARLIVGEQRRTTFNWVVRLTR